MIQYSIILLISKSNLAEPVSKRTNLLHGIVKHRTEILRAFFCVLSFPCPEKFLHFWQEFNLSGTKIKQIELCANQETCL